MQGPTCRVSGTAGCAAGRARAPEAELAAQDPEAAAEADAEVGDVAGVSRGGAAAGAGAAPVFMQDAAPVFCRRGLGDVYRAFALSSS